MTVYIFTKILLMTTCLAAQYEALFNSRNDDRIRVLLRNNEQLMIPKYASVKILHPLSVSPEPIIQSKDIKKLFYPQLSHQFGEFQLKTSDYDKDVVSFDSLFKMGHISAEPGVYLGGVNTQKILGDFGVDDIKPVTEHIDNDFKYDFRTKTHSIE